MKSTIGQMKRNIVIIDGCIVVMDEIKTVDECYELSTLAEDKGMQVKILNVKGRK